MKSKSLFILIAVLAISANSLVGCSSKTMSNKDSKSIIMGLDDTFAPMGFRDENGDLAGFDIDLAKEVFSRNGYEVKFQPIDWTMKETELNSGNIDVIWNGYSITEERREKVAFTDAYLENRQIIVTLADSSINSKSDLEGKK